MIQFVNWSGGAAAPTRAENPQREGGAGWAGLSFVRSSVRPSVTLEKGPKGLKNHQNTIRFFTKSEKWKFYVVLDFQPLAKCQ